MNISHFAFRICCVSCVPLPNPSQGSIRYVTSLHYFMSYYCHLVEKAWKTWDMPARCGLRFEGGGLVGRNGLQLHAPCSKLQAPSSRKKRQPTPTGSPQKQQQEMIRKQSSAATTQELSRTRKQTKVVESSKKQSKQSETVRSSSQKWESTVFEGVL